MNFGCMLGVYRVNFIAYADGIVLLSNKRKTLIFFQFFIEVSIY